MQATAEATAEATMTTAEKLSDPFAAMTTAAKSPAAMMPWEDKARLQLDAMSKQLRVDTRAVRGFEARWEAVKAKPVGSGKEGRQGEELRGTLAKVAARLDEHLASVAGQCEAASLKLKESRGMGNIDEHYKEVCRSSSALNRLLAKHRSDLLRFEFLVQKCTAEEAGGE